VLGPGGLLDARGDTGRRSNWASVTKLVTSLAVLVAREEEIVDLGEPSGPPGATVRHLLAHASGLDYDSDRVLAPPGHRRIYSNRGFEILGALVASRAGMPFAQYVDEAVLQPLAMVGTWLDGSPASGMSGPLDDLVRLAGELRAPTLVAASTIATATTLAFAGLAGVMPGFGAQDPLDWGLGIEVRGAKWPHWTGRANSPATFGHFGRSGSFLWLDPVAHLGCAVLSGRDFGAWSRDEWPALSDAVLEQFGTGTARADVPSEESGPPDR